MKKFKKPLIITAIVLDVGITVFLFVLSIMMLAEASKQIPKEQIDRSTLIGALQYNPTLFLWVVVVPLFVLLAANIVGLVIYVRKTSKKEPVQVDDLTDEQKEALRQELLKDLGGGSSEPKEEKQEQSEENKE